MGIFSRNKENRRTFYFVAQVTTKGGGFVQENLLRPEFPLFEDKKEIELFCKLLEKQGIRARPFPMNFKQEDLNDEKYKNLVFIGKKISELDYKCWSCKQLLNHSKIKWKPRTLKFSELSKPDDKTPEEHQKFIETITKTMGDVEQIASPNQIFGGQELEYTASCTNCGVILNCLWLGMESLKKNPNAILFNQNMACVSCDNILRREFQIWYSYRIVNQEGEREYMVTICPRCMEEQTYPFDYDLSRGVIE